jgi:hypothetical protein
VDDIRPSPSVLHYYPDAFKASWFLRAFFFFIKHSLGIGERRIAFLTSICSDDLNSVELPDNHMVGPFIQGGLDGYPFAGITGLGAFSHHLPLRGAAMMFFGPHVGITQSQLVGKVVRPGQKDPTACCGAASHALERLEAGQIEPKLPSCFAEDDYQQEKLEQLVLGHKDDILSAGPPGGPERFMRMSEFLYGDELQAMMDLFGSVHFDLPAFVFGGILINEDDGAESAIALRSAGRVESGTYLDITKECIEYYEPRFKAIQEGKTNVFP